MKAISHTLHCALWLSLALSPMQAQSPDTGKKSAKSGQTGKPGKRGKGKSGDVDTAAAVAAPFSALDALLPQGRSADKVALPQTDELGRLTQFTKAAKVTRTGDSTFAFEDLKLVAYNPLKPGSPVRVVDLMMGNFYRDSALIVSEGPSKITQSDVVITGKNLTFLTDDKVAQIQGPGKMEFRGTRSIPKTEHASTPSAAPTAQTQGTQTSKTPAK
jgi:hypothetical protein